MTNYIFALDFDGVICDSARETAASGWKAGRVIWPELFQGPLTEDLTSAFCAVRPVLKTGYESLILLKLILQGNSITDILTDYPALKKAVLADKMADKTLLKGRFGEARDEWMCNDLDSWLAANGFYDGTVQAVNACNSPVYILTTKQQRFAEALCRAGGLTVPKENIFGLESGVKANLLAMLLRKHPNSIAVFVEDKIQSLEEEEVRKLKDVRRIFAEWGYSTPGDRSMAQTIEGITSISRTDFAKLLANPENFLS